MNLSFWPVLRKKE